MPRLAQREEPPGVVTDAPRCARRPRRLRRQLAHQITERGDLRDEQRVARASEPGAVFGEMAMLLGGICTASVRCQTPARFAVIDQPMDFFAASPAASLHIARLLARRIDALNRYLVDVKRQYEGHDHLGMVDTVLGVLVHRQVAPQVERPPLSPKS